MPTYTDKFSSEFLTKEQACTALKALPKVLQHLLGDCTLIARYGWNCNIHGDLAYLPMRVSTDTLEWFIADSIDQRIVVPGETDLLFAVPENRLDLMFCHESDIHLNGEDGELIRQFMASEPFSQMQFHSREEMQRSKPQG